MKPVYAVRETTCHQCRESIPAGERRLDDGIKRGKFFMRIHYHPACAWMRWENWWVNNEGMPSPMIRQGRVSQLTPDEREIRNTALNALRGVCNYWIPKLNVTTKVEQLSIEEQRRYANFVLTFRKHSAVLEQLGGLPERYSNLKLPDIKIEEVVIEMQSDELSMDEQLE